MDDFKNIEEVLEYIVYLNNLSITKGNLVPFKNFLKFSPEKLAKKFELDELSLVKDFNQYKKEHAKIEELYKGRDEVDVALEWFTR